jgi:hypothetical protein
VEHAQARVQAWVTKELQASVGLTVLLLVLLLQATNTPANDVRSAMADRAETGRMRTSENKDDVLGKASNSHAATPHFWLYSRWSHRAADAPAKEHRTTMITLWLL